MLKNKIRGGPSIIFNHYQEVVKTLIRGNELCKTIIGFDAKALYLWAIMQDMPVGKYKHIMLKLRIICLYVVMVGITQYDLQLS